MASNKPTLYEFRGNHEYFVNGTSYSIRAYSLWTCESSQDGGVSCSTMKGRLHGNIICEPKHLLPCFKYKAEGAKTLRGCAKEKKLQSQLQSRFESKQETTSGHWLKVKL